MKRLKGSVYTFKRYVIFTGGGLFIFIDLYCVLALSLVWCPFNPPDDSLRWVFKWERRSRLREVCLFTVTHVLGWDAGIHLYVWCLLCWVGHFTLSDRRPKLVGLVPWVWFTRNLAPWSCGSAAPGIWLATSQWGKLSEGRQEEREQLV